jgi:hypothetical protein
MGMTGNKYRPQFHNTESAGVSWERRRLAGKLQGGGLENSPAGRQRSQAENTPHKFIYGH